MAPTGSPPRPSSAAGAALANLLLLYWSRIYTNSEYTALPGSLCAARPKFSLSKRLSRCLFRATLDSSGPPSERCALRARATRHVFSLSLVSVARFHINDIMFCHVRRASKRRVQGKIDLIRADLPCGGGGQQTLVQCIPALPDHVATRAQENAEKTSKGGGTVVDELRRGTRLLTFVHFASASARARATSYREWSVRRSRKAAQDGHDGARRILAVRVERPAEP